ncbi:MAG: PHP domain-containing protein, partial [Sinomonas sp.]|nr:PHP domain-containing protein [Sinomonas sp.]
MAESFTHLHVMGASSAPRGVSSPGELAAEAAADGATALACTDRDGLYGSVKHIAACLAEGLDPIVGVELAVLADGKDGAEGQDDGANPDGGEADDGANPDGGEADDGGSRPRARKPRRGAAGVAGSVVVLAHGRNGGAGWAALCRLVSDAHAHSGGRGGTPTPVGVLRSELAAHSIDPESGKQVLTVLIGPDSDVGRALSGPRYLRPRTLFRDWLVAMPAGVLAVELVTHRSPAGEALSTGHAVRMLRLASEHHVPAVLTNAVRAVTEGDADVAGLASSSEAWLKPAPLMQQLGHEIVRAAGLGAKDLAHLLSNTERIADRCRLDPVEDTGWGMPALPEASVLGAGGELLRELAERCRAGVARRFPRLTPQREAIVNARLDHELDLIGRLDLAPYVLAVAEVAGLIRGLGTRWALRGSGTSSLVNYVLGVSPLDPLRHALDAERFLPSGGGRLPSVGFDVESAERERVCREIVKRFGAERAVLMGARAGDAPGEAGPLAGGALGLAEEPDPSAAGSGGLPHERLVDLPERRGRASGRSATHVSGVIVGHAGLLGRIPVEPSGLRRPMSQFDQHDLARLGLLTLEIRGCPLQSAMAFAAREVERVEGVRIDLDAVPFDDVALDEWPFDDGPLDDVTEAALTRFQLAWLTAHHPAAFLVGMSEH